MILHAYVDVYVLCVCIVGHGYTTSLPKRMYVYDIKQSDGEDPVMKEHWGMRSTPL